MLEQEVKRIIEKRTNASPLVYKDGKCSIIEITTKTQKQYFTEIMMDLLAIFQEAYCDFKILGNQDKIVIAFKQDQNLPIPDEQVIEVFKVNL